LPTLLSFQGSTHLSLVREVLVSHFSQGLELQNMVQKNRQDFEMHLMKAAEDNKKVLGQSEN
jgi:uncharacterized membrane-anchored protein YhcB (DUF1043 family)